MRITNRSIRRRSQKLMDGDIQRPNQGRTRRRETLRPLRVPRDKILFLILSLSDPVYFQ